MSLGDILKNVAPVLASCFLGPEAGVAVNFLADKLGTPATIEAVTDRISGMSGDQLAKIKELDVEFQTHLDDNKTKIAAAELADVQNARDLAKSLVLAGQKNYMAISMYVLAVLVIFILTYEVIKDPNLNDYVKGIVTLVLGRFLGYLDGIYQFEFGTTRSSRTKDDTINKLTRS